MLTLKQQALAGAGTAVAALALIGGVIFAQSPGTVTPTPPAAPTQHEDCPHKDGADQTHGRHGGGHEGMRGQRGMGGPQGMGG